MAENEQDRKDEGGYEHEVSGQEFADALLNLYHEHTFIDAMYAVAHKMSLAKLHGDYLAAKVPGFEWLYGN